MASSSRHARTLSPPVSTAFSSATAGQVKLNVVTRVAIEGKARKGVDGKADGAAIRMFLKIAIPVDSVAPGSTIPLFPEENVKILDSQVHPLDSSSAPYNFSSTTSTLLHKEEDSGSWDLTSDPHVTRTSTPSRHSRSHTQKSYTHFADDESSDSSTAGFADGCGIQGTFQSAERIRIRWAKPIKPDEMAETADGRRRVGIREVSSVTTCTVLDGRQNHQDKGKGWSTLADGSVVMGIGYNATCKGIWSPGVATMLGLDIGLNVGDCDVEWAPGTPAKWNVSGSTGFTGFAVGAPAIPHTKPPLSRQSSASDSTPFLLPSPDGHPSALANGYSQNAMRVGSSASLLRAPLPNQNVTDYSFESPNLTPTSSVASLATIPSSPERHRRSRASSLNDGQFTDTDIDQDAKSPDVPVTIHVNMNDLPPPSKNILELSITGVIIVTPRRASRTSSPTPAYVGGQSDSNDKNPVVLPRFRVLHCERESSSILVWSELDSASIDVYKATGNITDAQSRKTVIQPGGQAKCGSEGARLAIRSSQSPVVPRTYQAATPRHREEESFGVGEEERLLKTPKTNGLLKSSPSASVLRRTSMFSPSILRPMRDGPLMIPSITATVTPLLSSTQTGQRRSTSQDYAVRVCLPAPSDADSEWLEFGLAIPPTSTDPHANPAPPKVQVASASLEGVPVHFETTATAKLENESSSPVGLPFEETSGKEWVTWVKVHVGEGGGGSVEVVYLVKNVFATQAPKKSRWTGKAKAKDASSELHVLLPTFPLPVGRLEVHVETQAGLEIQEIRSNFTHESASPTGKRLMHYSMEEFFYPRLSMTIRSSKTLSSSPSILWRLLQFVSIALPTAMALVLLANNSQLESELAQAKQSLISYPRTAFHYNDDNYSIPPRAHTRRIFLFLSLIILDPNSDTNSTDTHSIRLIDVRHRTSRLALPLASLSTCLPPSIQIVQIADILKEIRIGSASADTFQTDHAPELTMVDAFEAYVRSPEFDEACGHCFRGQGDYPLSNRSDSELSDVVSDDDYGPFAKRGYSGSIIVDGHGKLAALLTGGTGPGDFPDITFGTPMHWLWEIIEAEFPGASLDFDAAWRR
ncbi:hypothetical protein EUX98_g5693 [Antrodiella citrinella]|uniref:Uncharacterized protein n=1 Tax=Antrodiella citrinella TaxID=2447956 RepID=A0A4S4MT06_9APHY|nr:hypothetical protein EUX98_g5693 [Antrodiella citrinella]